MPEWPRTGPSVSPPNLWGRGEGLETGVHPVTIDLIKCAYIIKLIKTLDTSSVDLPGWWTYYVFGGDSTWFHKKRAWKLWPARPTIPPQPKTIWKFLSCILYSKGVIVSIALWGSSNKLINLKGNCRNTWIYSQARQKCSWDAAPFVAGIWGKGSLAEVFNSETRPNSR